MRLLLLIFLGTITLIRRAQKNIFTKLEASSSSLLGILPHDEQGLNLRNSVHEGNIQRVIAILQGNIKQWSFIEAQLLEPNVNLAMPEIFIPLKHLTTTLEILGNIFFMKNDYEEARKCLERACPLMELLPSSIIESDAMGSGNAGGSIDEFSFLPDNEIDESIREQIMLNNHNHRDQYFHASGKNYASGCFELLRSVYLKLYGLNETSEEDPKEERWRTSSSSGKSNEEDEFDDFEGFDSELRFSGSYDDIGFEEDEVTTPTPNSPSDVKQFSEIEVLIEELRSPFQHLRSELKMVQGHTMELDADEDIMSEDPVIRELHDESSEQIAGFTSSRGPAPGITQDLSKRRGVYSPPEGITTDTGIASQIMLGFKGFVGKLFSVFAPLLDHRGKANDLFAEQELGDRDRAHLSSAAFQELSGSATSMIASDLEEMLRKFVREDEDGRREIYEMVRRYYEELEVNYPQMDENEFAANMDLGLVYLEVMGRVVKEGFGFVGPELERWQDIGHNLVSKHMPSSLHGLNEDKSYGVGIIWEIDPETGKKQEFAVELDGSYFDAFSLQERNRLLVLSAFDIALNLEPYEQFDLSLGFGLGILDNDRSRQRDHTALSFYHQTAPNQQPHLLNVQKPHTGNDDKQIMNRGRKNGQTRERSRPVNTPSAAKLREGQPIRGKSSVSETIGLTQPVASSKPDPEVEPAMFMEQTSATLEIPAALRSSVPMIKLENDWTLFLLISFVMITVFIVYIAYYQDLKKRLRQRASSTRSQKKAAGANVGPASSASASSEGIGSMEAFLMLGGDIYDYIFPLFSSAVLKVLTFSADVLRSLKVSLSRLIVQVSLSLREKRETIFPNQSQPHSIGGTSTTHGLPASIPSKQSHSHSSSSQTKRQTNNTSSSTPQKAAHRRISVDDSHQTWQQISETTDEGRELGEESMSQSFANEGQETSRKKSATPPDQKRKKSNVGKLNHGSGRENEVTVKSSVVYNVTDSSTTSSAEDEPSSDNEGVASLKPSSARKVVSASKPSIVSAVQEELKPVEEMMRGISEDNLYNEPEKYEAIVSSLLAEGQWKQAKKKAPKKEKSSSTTSNPVVATNSSTEIKEKRQKPPHNAPTNNPRSKSSFVGESLNRRAIPSVATISFQGGGSGSSTSWQSGQKTEDLSGLEKDKKSSSLTLSLESMLPPAILEHKPSSLPPMNPTVPSRAWKQANQKRTEKNDKPIGTLMIPEKTDKVSDATRIRAASNLSESDRESKLSVEKLSPDQPSVNAPLPAMPALLPAATVHHQSTTLVNTNGTVGLNLREDPVLSTTSSSNILQAPPPGLLPARNAFSMYSNPAEMNYNLRSASANGSGRFVGSSNSLLSSILGTSSQPELHSNPTLARNGRMINQAEEDNDSNELLRGMLDDILRPASPPMVEGLFSKKAASEGDQGNVMQHSFMTRNTNASVEDLISDLSPDAPVFQPLTLSSQGAGLARSFQLQGSYYDSSLQSSSQYLETSSLSNLGQLAGEGLWSFHSNQSNQSYLLSSLAQPDDVLSDSVAVDSSLPSASQPQPFGSHRR